MDYSEIVKETVAETLVEASTKFREDQIKAYRTALEREENENGRWVLERILENAQLAEEIRMPLCNDTGIPHILLDVGKEVTLKAKLLEFIEEGVKLGLRRLPGRPMAVKGEGLERIGQNTGLYGDPGMLSAAPLQIRMIQGKRMMVTVLMLGGGPDLRGKTYHIFHRHQGTILVETMAKWAAEEVWKLGCTPTVPIFGIGRTHYEATCMMLEAMKEGDLLKQNDMERMVTDIINETHVGPLGFGGETTAIGSFIRIGPLRAGGARIVSMRLGCCWDPRRATREIPI